MAERGFRVKVRLYLHAITCPGVWLCPNGKVALRITTLDSTLESHRVSPIFPLLFHNEFTFKKIFTRTAALTELQQNLGRESIYAELIQWLAPCNRRIVLASFESNLVDLLYPTSSCKGLFAGTDVDLLMESSKYFPGIISPKIEISSKTVIEEVHGIFDANIDGTPWLINPRIIDSKHKREPRKTRPVKGILRQRSVCHARGKSAAQICRPLSADRQGESTIDDRPDRARVNRGRRATRERSIVRCFCLSDSERKVDNVPSGCADARLFDGCPVCQKYKCYFSRKSKHPNVDIDLDFDADLDACINERKRNFRLKAESSSSTDRSSDCCRLRPNDASTFAEPISPSSRSTARYLRVESKERPYCTDRDCKTIE